MIVLSGMLAGVPWQGGASWAVLEYLLGLHRLGHDVLFVEPVDTGGLPLDASPAAQYFRHIVARFGLDRTAALIDPATGSTVGVDRRGVERFADAADLLLNISGALACPDLLGRIAIRAYVDVDPAFTQLWHEVQHIDLGLDRHNRFVTIGQAVGTSQCTVPSCGRTWITTPQPVVLEHWPVAHSPTPEILTTIGHWRAYGSIEYRGTLYGQRAHSLRRFLDLPTLIDVPVVAALDIHPAETADIRALRRRGWTLVDPVLAAGTPKRYEQFVRQSWAELGIAKSGYVAAACGWFSDRSICYLASGRPVIAQDTGFSAHLPTGEGLLTFRTLDESVAAVEELRSDYARHRRAARAIADEVFDSDRVLSRLLACL